MFTQWAGSEPALVVDTPPIGDGLWRVRVSADLLESRNGLGNGLGSVGFGRG